MSKIIGTFFRHVPENLYFCSEMSATVVICLLFFCFVSALVQRVCGFGFGIFIMTVLPYVMPSYGEATTLSGLLASVTSAMIVARMHRHILWRALMPILITFIAVSIVAVQLVVWSAGSTMRTALFVMLIAASVYFYLFSERVKVSGSLPVQVSMGTLSGFMGGMFGMQGPPAVLYFLGVARTKEQYVALAQTYFLIGNLCMTLFRARGGFLTPEVGKAWAVGLVAVLFGTWVGGKVFDRISASTLRKLVYAYMGISGVIALLC